VSDAGARALEARASDPERARGYLQTGGAALINGAIGTMVSYATAPASMLLAMRMGCAAIVLGAVWLLHRDFAELRRPGVAVRLLAIGFTVAANLLFYFLAIRATGVAVAIFLSYLAPVYVALVAPRFDRTKTEGVVYVALGVALLGMAAIIVPGLTGEGLRLSALGLFYAWAAGAMYCVALLLSKGLRRRNVRSTTIVLSESVVTFVAVLPLGLLATVGRYHITNRDVAMAVMLGLLTTALSFSLFAQGMRYIRVQHASIMGYIEPVSAPLYALVFLGQRPSPWTILGGALVIAGGVLVVALGKAEQEELL
jgi:drug/metabolite transporter (DMT)-like permease